MTKVINCISSPRNLSTALMYSFAQRNDTEVIDEPFYAYYLLMTGKDHPGREEVLRSQPVDPGTVFENIANLNTKPVLFIKNMAKHMEVVTHKWPEAWTSLFLIRDPKAVVASFDKGYPDPAMDDIGIDYQWLLYQREVEQGKEPVIVDTVALRSDPERILAEACRRLAIPFDVAMLSWPVGPRPEDGVWAKYWYHRVHRSTRFVSPSGNKVSIPGHLEDLCKQAISYYDKLSPYAIR